MLQKNLLSPDDDAPSTPRMRERMAVVAKRLIYSRIYLYYFLSQILLNLIQILLLFRPWASGGVHMDLNTASNVEQILFLGLEIVVSVLLIAEVAIKLFWLRCRYFAGADRWMNSLDLVLAIACFGMLAIIAHGEGQGGLAEKIDSTADDSDERAMVSGLQRQIRAYTTSGLCFS